MITVHIERIKGRTFNGYIYKNELTEAQQALFPRSQDTVEIEGDFDVEWDDDILEVIVGSVLAYERGAELVLNADEFNCKEVEDYIAEKAYADQEADREASLADYYYDMYR